MYWKTHKAIILGQKIYKEKLKKAKELRREMTEAERILWNRLRRNQISGLHFRRQQIIEGFIVDFYCHEARLVIEVDGEIHEYRTYEDRIREDLLKSKGLRIMRVTNYQVINNLEEVINKIENECQYSA